jgi:hypothetical protein
LDKILDDKNVQKFINIQDYINKDTPLHIATAFGLTDVIEKLIKKGADVSIRNENGEYVCVDIESDNNSNKSNDIFMKKKNIDQTLKNVVNLFFKGQNNKNNNTSEVSLKMTDIFGNNNSNNLNPFNNIDNLSSTSPNIQNTANTEQKIDQLIHQQTESPTSNSNNITDELISEIIKNQNLNEPENDTNSTEIIKRIINNNMNDQSNNIPINIQTTNQKGGRQILGKRYMKTTSDIEMMGGQVDSQSSIDAINDRDNQFKRNVGAMETATGWQNNGKKEVQILGRQGLVSIEGNSPSNNDISGAQTVGDINNTPYKYRGEQDFRLQERYNYDNDNQYASDQRYRMEENKDYKFGRGGNYTATSDNDEYKNFSRGSTETSNYDTYRAQNRAVNQEDELEFDENDDFEINNSSSINYGETKTRISDPNGSNSITTGKNYNRPNKRLLNSNIKNTNKNELSRMIQNQADVIHKRTVEKIKDLLGVDEEKAKIYKAALYNKIKTEHPELNNFDRAVEMEKIATTENLKSINFQEWENKIKKNRDEKTKSMNNSSSDKNKNLTKKSKNKDNISEQSLFYIDTDSSIPSLSS